MPQQTVFTSKAPASRSLKRRSSRPPSRNRQIRKRERSVLEISSDSEGNEQTFTATKSYRSASQTRTIRKTTKKQASPRQQASPTKPGHLRFFSDTVDHDTEDDTDSSHTIAEQHKPRKSKDRALVVVSPKTPIKAVKGKKPVVCPAPPGTPGAIDRPIDVDDTYEDHSNMGLLRPFPYPVKPTKGLDVPDTPRALYNDGSASCCNAILQLLLNTPMMVNTITSCGKTYDQKHKNSILSTLHDICVDYHTPSMAPYEASKQALLKSLSARGGGSGERGTSQMRDASLFLEFLIKEVKRDLWNQPLRRSRQQGGPRRPAMSEMWQALFFTDYEKQRNCYSCDRKDVEVEDDSIMHSLKFRIYQRRNLQSLFEESLTSACDEWTCPEKKCRYNHDAKETQWERSLQNLPEVLFIRRDEFKVDNVVLPFHFGGDETLDLTPFLHPSRRRNVTSAKYQLYGAVSFSPTARVVGQTDKGRYVTVVRVGDEWWECNDSLVQKIDIEKWGKKQIPEKLIYNVMLFAFKRIDETDADTLTNQSTSEIDTPTKSSSRQHISTARDGAGVGPKIGGPRKPQHKQRNNPFVLVEASCSDDEEHSEAEAEDGDTDLSGFIVDDDAELSEDGSGDTDSDDTCKKKSCTKGLHGGIPPRSLSKSPAVLDNNKGAASQSPVGSETLEPIKDEPVDDDAASTPLALLSGPIALKGNLLESEAFIHLALPEADQLVSTEQTLIMQISGYHEGRACIISLSGTLQIGDDIVTPSNKESRKFCRGTLRNGEDWPSLYKLHAEQKHEGDTKPPGGAGSSDDINKLRIELSKVLSENAQLKAQSSVDHKACIEEKDALEEKLAQLSPPRAPKAKEMAELKSAHKKITEECSKLRAENAVMATECDMIQKNADNLLTTYRKLQSEKQEMVADAEEQAQKHENREHQVRELEKQIEDLKRQVAWLAPGPQPEHQTSMPKPRRSRFNERKRSVTSQHGQPGNPPKKRKTSA